MLENNPSDLVPLPSALPAPIKRYAPPNQRNRNLNRRKSGDRLEKTSSLHGSDIDRNVAGAFHSAGSYDADCSNSFNGVSQRRIPLDGCSNSEASKLLQTRWDVAIRLYHDPKIDLSERPIMYTGSSGNAWGGRLPHQLIFGNQLDFLTELWQQRQNHKDNLEP